MDSKVTKAKNFRPNRRQRRAKHNRNEAALEELRNDLIDAHRMTSEQSLPIPESEYGGSPPEWAEESRMRKNELQDPTELAQGRAGESTFQIYTDEPTNELAPSEVSDTLVGTRIMSVNDENKAPKAPLREIDLVHTGPSRVVNIHVLEPNSAGTQSDDRVRVSVSIGGDVNISIKNEVDTQARVGGSMRCEQY